jgi:hypothetical protein
MLAEWVVIVMIVVVIATIVAGVMLYRLQRALRDDHAVLSIRNSAGVDVNDGVVAGDDSVRMVHHDIEQAAVVRLPVNPLEGLDYVEALTLTPLYERLAMANCITVLESVEEMRSQRSWPKELTKLFAPITKSVRLVDSVVDIERSGRIVWEISKEGEKAVRQGLATLAKTKDGSRYLPALRDGSGRFRDLIKGRDPSELLKLTKCANLIVNAANIISGADQAKKLEKIDKKVGELLANSKAELASALESNYYLISLLLSYEDIDRQRDRLWSVLKELYELRANWRRQIERKIEETSDPNEEFFAFIKSKKSMNAKVEEALSFNNELHLLKFSMLLTMILYSLLGIDQSRAASEAVLYEDLYDKWTEKSKFVSAGSEQERRITEAQDYYKQFVIVLRTLEGTDLKANRVVLAEQAA